jgi:asparagine synthase (glutamine-hydrolysing)
MCGITGISYHNALKDTLDIQQMSDAISHRGPDGEGFIAVNSKSGIITELGGKKTPVNLPPLSVFGTNADIYLAHRRLSIIDLSTAGHQPMTNVKRDIWITFNGEIYNYKALKNELSEFTYKSNADTEVLLYAYEKWGIDCLRHLNGMWAFVIYDARKNLLFGARDRFGVKPLYYIHNNDFFAFNSEIKGLLANHNVSRKINTGASAAFLKTGLLNFQGETFFNDIVELQPSNYFIYDLSKKTLNIQRYYELPFYDVWEKFDEKKCRDYIEGTKERVINAVDLRLNADVTVGSCLSGGMDSSAIVCSINNLLGKRSYNSIGPKQAVVTACYENLKIDESKWAKLAVDHVSAEWHRVFPQKEELFNDLSDLVYSQDVPFGSTSIYAQYRVMKTAKEAGITVMLDGQGGDELFTGYMPYYHVFYSEAKRNNDRELLRNEQDFAFNTPLNISLTEKSINKAYILSIIKKYMPRNMKKIIKKYFWYTDSASKYIRSREKSYRDYSYNTLNKMLYTLMAFSSLPDLLKYEDRNSMRFSIESRTPFADDIDLIEYVFAIPGIYKIHNGWSKYLLRESMANIVPNEIKTRTDKIGFETPEYDWLGPIKPYIFENNNSNINMILNMKRFEKSWDEIFLKQNKNGVTDIWRYINFILWFNTFKVAV